MCGAALFPPTLATSTIRPDPRAFMSASTASVVCLTARKCVFSDCS